MQTLTELDAPAFSVLTPHAAVPPAHSAPPALDATLALAREIVANKSAGAGALVPDGSAGDPASNGVGVLLANWTALGGADYAGAARGQLEHLLQQVPRTSDGAISHREGYVQLWCVPPPFAFRCQGGRLMGGRRSDSVYMVPPFIAYYGALTGNKTLLDAAYDQVRLYRGHLMDKKMGGLWKHVLLGPSANDPGYWSTGASRARRSWRCPTAC